MTIAKVKKRAKVDAKVDAKVSSPLSRESKTLSTLRTAKTSLNTILIDDLDGSNQMILLDAICRTHQIYIHVCHLIRLYILDKYHKKEQIPKITINFISMAFKVISKNCKGGNTPKGANLKLLNNMKLFYMSDYKKLGYTKKISGKNLSHIFNYMKTDILTNIENNVKMHFMSYVKRFVNSSFREGNNKLLEKAIRGTKVALRKELNKDLYDIKEDLINNTLKSNIKYHEWINKHKPNILPTEFKHSYEFDIKHEPQKYIKNMIYMCVELEKINGKSFQFLPIRANIIPKYIPIDTAILVDLFIVKDQKTYLDNISEHKKELWNKYFKTSDPVFNQSKYSFDYMIKTDGFAVSIQLIDKLKIESENLKKKNKKDKRMKMERIYNTMTQKQKEKLKEKNKLDEKNMKIEFQLQRKKESDLKKAAFKKLSKDVQKKQRALEKVERDRKKSEKYIEFPYLEDLNTTEYSKLKKDNNWVVCDPGKRVLLYLKNEKGDCLRYTNKTHLKKIKRIKYQTLLQNYKKKNGIDVIERQLTSYNSKSCIYSKFKDYIKKKNVLNKQLLDKYENEIFRKYKWYGYINRKKAETDLVRQIKKTFSKDVTLVYGDWSSGHQMKNFISTPNLGLKRKLGEYFKIYNIDEFRTSCLNHKTLGKCENLYLPDKKEVPRKIHSILTYTMENNRKGCINRDNNAVNNMITITNQFIKDKTRPLHFTRGIKLEDIKKPPIKDVNLKVIFNKTITIY